MLNVKSPRIQPDPLNILILLFHEPLEILQKHVTEIIVTAQDMRRLVVLPCHEMRKRA